MPPEGAPSRRRLASLQAATMALITGRDTGVEETAVEELVVGDARANAADRLHVYWHMYRARLLEALVAQFPRLAKWLGPDAFAELSAAYFAAEPSRHFSLREAGRRFPDWLAARRPDAPSLAGLAALEWARTDVFDQKDDEVLTLAALQAWPAEAFAELPVRLVTAHRLIQVHAGAACLWDAAGEDPVGEEPIAAGPPTWLLVWREGTRVYHRHVNEQERSALVMAARGVAFGALCEALLETHDEQGAVAQAYAHLSTWLTDGLLRAV